MTQDLSGQTIGNYAIGDLLGSGGMGQVYRGTHTLLNRAAAVKVMHPHLAADPTFRSRFLQEAKAAAELDHPNIVQIYEFDERDGQFILVMELVTGGSLRRLMREEIDDGKWSLRSGLELIRQVTEGLSYAHSRSMVHRDIKPDNLLLKTADHREPGAQSYVVKISDFGLARLAESPALTASGVTMGTPAYMSPEQAQGVQVDGRSDLYSLGVVLYELATGYLPFETRTLSDAVYKHVYVDPTPPRELNEELPPELESVILRCLKKQPADRFASAAELIEAIQRVEQQMDPVTSIPESHSGVPDERTTQELTTDAQPPAEIPEVSATSSAPRIQILGSTGVAYQVVHLPDDGISVGRLTENDVTLPDESVSRRHLSLSLDGDRVLVTDLGSWNGSSLGGERLLPHVSQTWNSGDWLRVGSYWMRLIPATPEHVQSDPGPRYDAGPADGGRIRIVLEHDSFEIEPGSPVTLRGTLVNLGNTVDHLRISVEGAPDEWVEPTRDDIQLNPGDQAGFELQINVPRSYRYLTGRYPVRIHAVSREIGGTASIADAVWQVLPFSDFSMELAPSRSSGRTRADFQVQVANQGNQPEMVALNGQDDEGRLRFQFEHERFRIEPGGTGSVQLQVRVPRRWFGRSTTYPFEVSSKLESGDTRTASGQLAQRSTIPALALVLAILGVAALGAVFALSILPSNGTAVPSIDRFTIDPVEVTQGESVTIAWSVSNADRIVLELPGGRVERDLPSGGTAEDIPLVSGSYTLTGVNAEGTESIESQAIEVIAELDDPPPVEPVQALQPTVEGLERGSDRFRISLENPNEVATVQVSVFSTSVSDNLGNQYELDPFAMDHGLQVTVPAGGTVNLDYVLRSTIAEDADSVTFVLSDMFARQDNDAFLTALSPIQIEESLP